MNGCSPDLPLPVLGYGFVRHGGEGQDQETDEEDAQDLPNEHDSPGCKLHMPSNSLSLSLAD